MPHDTNTDPSPSTWLATSALVLVLVGAFVLRGRAGSGDVQGAVTFAGSSTIAARSTVALLGSEEELEDSVPDEVGTMASAIQREPVAGAERARLLAAMQLRVRAETPTGAPIEGLVFHNGGSSWGDNFDYTTDASGEVTLQRPRTRARFEWLERRLTFDDPRRFPLSEARLEGEVFILVMDDVGMVKIELVDRAGRPTYGEPELVLSGEYGEPAPVGVEAESAETDVSGPDSGGTGGRTRGERFVQQGPGLLPVPLGLRNAGCFLGPLGKQGWLPLVDPGSVEHPPAWRIELQEEGCLLRGILTGVDPEWGLQCALGFSSTLTLGQVELGPDGRFELRIPAVPRDWDGGLPRLRQVQIAARSPDDGHVHFFARSFDPALSTGIHDLGRLHADTEPLVAAGRVVTEDGLPVSGATVRLVDGGSLERRGRSLTSTLGIHADDGWWSARTAMDGQFEIRGSTSLEQPALYAEHEGLRVLKSQSLFAIGGWYELVLGTPLDAGFSWRYAATSERSGQALLELRRLDERAEEGLIFSLFVSPGAYGFPLVPGTYELSLRESRGGPELLKARGVVAQQSVGLGSTVDPELANFRAVEGWEDLVVE